MLQENKHDQTSLLRPEGALTLRQYQRFLAKCLHDGINTVLVPELDRHAYFKGKVSLVAYLIYTGQIGLLSQLSHADFIASQQVNKCPPLVTAVMFNQLPIAEYLNTQGLGTWRDTYRGFDIMYHALIAGHSELANCTPELRFMD